MSAITCLSTQRVEEYDDLLFSAIASDLTEHGYSIKPSALPYDLMELLLTECLTLQECKFRTAGIGRGDDFSQNKFVRTDEISWISRDTQAGRLWLDWSSELQTYLNRNLFLGLGSFESHYAHYKPGKYYKRHVDAFTGEKNRILSVVVYLNPNWQHTDGGELVLYKSEEDLVGIKTTPLFGTIVVFLSEAFPHEVLPSKRDRFSIAGWFRASAQSGFSPKR